MQQVCIDSTIRCEGAFSRKGLDPIKLPCDPQTGWPAQINSHHL